MAYTERRYSRVDIESDEEDGGYGLSDGDTSLWRRFYRKFHCVQRWLEVCNL